MTFLAMEREIPGRTADEFAPHLEAEAAAVWNLYRAGTVRQAYFRQDWHGAVLLLESPDTEEARRALDDLPLVRNGLIAFDLIPLGPYTGLERLFRQPGSSRE